MIAVSQKKRFESFISSMSHIVDGVADDDEKGVRMRSAAYDYRRGLADDIDKIIERSGLIVVDEGQPIDFLRRQLADDIAKYFTGG